MNKKATSTAKPTVKIIGVGCGGNNIVNHISQSHLEGFSFIACDMDANVLEKSAAATTLQIGTDGLGSGNNPEKANIAAEECGTGAAPVIARESKKKSISTVALATLPFELEGERRFLQASEGI